ncbi:MAG TPA: hypothetical protein QGH10_02450, partial [Armatimonadota bacterium]|nr:hypothetical protein [Armatimonadota bacterium]
WARDWSMRWDALEPVKGDLSFALSDGQINWVARTGMKQMALMPPFPSSEWASEAPENLRELVPDKPPRIRQAYAPRDPQDLCAFIDQAVRHCQGRIGVYEFLNEPVFTYYGLPTSIYGLPGAEYTPMDYLELLRPAYATMKAADPDCLVSGGFGAPTMLYAREFVEAGGLDHLDIYNLHTYAELSAPERFVEGLATLQNLMDASDAGRKPLWITECGCYASDDKPWTPWAVPEGHWAGPLQVSDEKQAAAYSVRHAAILMACGAEKFFYHMGCDGEVNNGSQELANPLLGPLGEPKKFYVALSVMANSLGPNPVYAAHLDKPSSIDGLSTFDVHGYAFQCDERAVLIAWKAASRFEWAIDVPEDAVACNIIGAPLTTGKAQLGESPIYVTTESMTAQELAGACALSSTYAGNGEGNSAAQEHVERFDDGSPDGIWGIGWTGWCTGGEGDIAIKDGVCRFINDSATDGYMTAHINNLQHPLAPYFTLEFSIPRLSELPDHGAAITTRYLVAEATEATEQPGLRVGKVGDFCIIERSTGGALISYPASSATSVSVRQTVRPDGVTVACSIDGGGFTELGATIPWEGVDATDEISIIVQANDLTGMDRRPVLSIPSRGPFDIAIDNLVLTHSR